MLSFAFLFVAHLHFLLRERFDQSLELRVAIFDFTQCALVLTWCILTVLCVHCGVDRCITGLGLRFHSWVHEDWD